MGGYGYTFQSYSAYTSGGSRTDDAFEPFRRSSLVPNSYGRSEGYLTKKTVVPAATRPYANGSPTKAYPATYDTDDELYPQTNPVHGRPHKVDDLLAKKTRVPVATGPYGHGSPTKAYPATYDTDDELYPQTGPVHGRPHKTDDLLAKKTRVPVATRPSDDEFEYQHSSPTARGDDKRHRQTSSVHGGPPKTNEFPTKKTRVPVASRPYGEDEKAYSARDRDYVNSPVYDRPHKADDFLAKKTGVPGATTPYGVENRRSAPTARDDDRSPPARFSPVISTNWRHSPQSTGSDGSSHTENDSYKPSRSGAVISPGWTSLPRKGTRLSEATNDFDKMLKEVARLSSGSESYRATGKGGVMDRPTPSVREEPPPSKGVDKRDGTRRYGNLNPASTIDSTEAEKKYNGMSV